MPQPRSDHLLAGGPLSAPVPRPAAVASVGRDPALDLLRSIALARVVLWHTFAATWMTFFAAIPVLFFVAGALLAVSRDGRSYPSVVRGQGRRSDRHGSTAEERRSPGPFQRGRGQRGRTFPRALVCPVSFRRRGRPCVAGASESP